MNEKTLKHKGFANLLAPSTIMFILAVLSTIITASCKKSDELHRSSIAQRSIESPRPVIRFAHNWGGLDGKAPYWVPLLEAFARDKSAQAEFIFEHTDNMEHLEKIRIDAATGRLPDIYTYWATEALLRPLVEQDGCLDIREYLKESHELRVEDFPKEAWDTTTLDGIPIGIPVESYGGLLLVNLGLLTELGLNEPENFKDLVRMIEPCETAGKVLLALGSVGGDPGHLFFSEIALQHFIAEHPDRPPQEYAQSRSAALAAAEYIHYLQKSGAFPKPTEALAWDEAALAALFDRGEALFAYVFPWTLPSLKRVRSGSIKIIPFPALGVYKARESTKYHIGGIAMAYFINPASYNNPDKRAIITAFLDYLISWPVLDELSRSDLVAARRNEVRNKEEQSLYNEVRDFLDNTLAVQPHETFFTDRADLSAFKDAVDLLFAGRLDPEAFLKISRLPLK